MKYLITTTLLFIYGISVAQNEATTTLTTLLYDYEIPLMQKNKKTHSGFVQLEISPDYWNQFERIDAVFVSAWLGSGEIAKVHYKKDLEKINSSYQADPVIYFAEKAPGFFTYPRKQAGYGTELVLFHDKPDSNCLRRYNKGKISPKGIYPCMVTRFHGTTPVIFFYRYALPKGLYSSDKCPSLNLLLRTSAKADTVIVDTKIAITIMGKRHKTLRNISLGQFLKEAILSGLKEDAFPLNHARWIAENESVFFVTKCPICLPVQDAFRDYIKNYEEKMSKVPNELLDGVVLGKVEEKKINFSKIVNRYVDRYFENSDMNEREINDMRAKLEEGRKVGMSRKSDSFGPFCPSCDGACKIK